LICQPEAQLPSNTREIIVIRSDFAGFVAIAVLLGGCSQAGSETYWVSGTVTLDRKPLTDGDVIFYLQNQTALAAMGKVDHGAFRFQAVAGKHRVVIQASRPSPTRKGATGEPAYISIIPDRYNTRSQLTAEVRPNDPNQFTFNLESR
jgi:hypothetical protein